MAMETENFIDIVFDGPPSHESGRFVEVENAKGESIKFGEWVERADGYWALRIPADAPADYDRPPKRATDEPPTEYNISYGTNPTWPGPLAGND